MNWNLLVTGSLFLGLGAVLFVFLNLLDGLIQRFIPGLRREGESQSHLGAFDGMTDFSGMGGEISQSTVSETCPTALVESCGSNEIASTVLASTEDVTSQMIEGGSEIISGLVDGL